MSSLSRAIVILRNLHQLDLKTVLLNVYSTYVFVFSTCKIIFEIILSMGLLKTKCFRQESIFIDTRLDGYYIKGFFFKCLLKDVSVLLFIFVRVRVNKFYLLY